MLSSITNPNINGGMSIVSFMGEFGIIDTPLMDCELKATELNDASGSPVMLNLGTLISS